MTVTEENQINHSPQQRQRRSSVVSTKVNKDGLTRKHSERHQVMQIQNYVIYRKTIGAGSMGKVKLAECLDDVHKQKYAVKIMPKIDLNTIISAKTNSNKPRDPKDTPEEREQRTIREMAIMRLLRHPNICQLKEYISEEDKYYMFLEYVDGGQLLDYIIKNGKLREKQARKFARQIISALDYCHRNSIVHRDLKIENILITRTEQLKIIDFGLSNVYSPNQQLDTFCGSLYFAAPELLKARQYVGPEVDVWSFGVVLYVLVCGKVPFDDSNLPALHEKIKAGVIEEYPEHLGKECLDLLSKIFVVDPSRRITLTGIKAHPWMNKGYEEPIRNYLPRRQPLETIDMDIVRGMNGFGLGSPEEIKERLEKIISFPAYQEAAMKIDENYQIAAQDDPSTANKSRWRRSLSTSRKRKVELSDDFQSLPAMYDPLISIYHLVKERRETEERKKQLLNAPSAPVTGLSRSTSTFVAGRKSNQPTSRDSSHQHNPHVTMLTRRRTYDTSKKLPALPPINHRRSKQSSDITPPKPVRSHSTAATLLRKKSLQAVRKLGIIRSPTTKSMHRDISSSSSHHDTKQQIDDINADSKPNKPSSSSIPFMSSLSSSSTTTSSTTTESRIQQKTAVTANEYNNATTLHHASPRKSHWLKLDFNNSSPQRRQSAISSGHRKQQSSWKRLSMHRKSPTRLSFDTSVENLPNAYLDPTLSTATATSDPNNSMSHYLPTEKKTHHPISSTSKKESPIIMKTSKSEHISNTFRKSPPAVTTSLKSLFQFNKRGHLFRMTPNQLITEVKLVLYQLDIEILSVENYQLNCRCSPHVVATYGSKEGRVTLGEDPFVFFVMVYEARWAGGKIGIKLKEQQHHDGTHSLYNKQLLRNLYHDILSKIEKK